MIADRTTAPSATAPDSALGTALAWTQRRDSLNRKSPAMLPNWLGGMLIVTGIRASLPIMDGAIDKPVGGSAGNENAPRRAAWRRQMKGMR